MAVQRINPSPEYRQEELSRIQEALVRAIEDLQLQLAALKKQLGVK